MKQYKYLLVTIDDYTRYMTVKPLRIKSDTREALTEIISTLEVSCNGEKVGTVQADWGGEFRNKELELELKQRGAKMKETVPHHRETNPVIERANRTIFTRNRTAITASGLPKGLWDLVSAHSTYTKNRIPHKAL